jgi:hypothetical protein
LRASASSAAAGVPGDLITMSMSRRDEEAGTRLAAQATSPSPPTVTTPALRLNAFRDAVSE